MPTLTAPPARAPRAVRATPGGAPRRWRAIALSAALLAVAVIASLCLGGRDTTIAEVAGALFAPTGSDVDVTIRGLRLPRTVLGIVVGACLGVAGVLSQGHTRNPVADPGLLGIYQGAALAIVTVTALGHNPPAVVVAACAFGGALAAALLVFGIASATAGRANAMAIVLAGLAISSLAASLVTAVSLLNLDALDQLRFWQVGSLASRTGALELVWPCIVAGLLLAAANARSLDALALGDDAAQSLGLAPARARTVGIAAIVLLAGSAVMLAGPIAFAGLIVPHLARALVGQSHAWLLTASALIGPAVLLLADAAGRVIARPGELSVTVVLAVLGAPLLVAIARRRGPVRL